MSIPVWLPYLVKQSPDAAFSSRFAHLCCSAAPTSRSYGGLLVAMFAIRMSNFTVASVRFAM